MNIRRDGCRKISVDYNNDNIYYSFSVIIELSTMAQKDIEKCFIYLRLSMLGLSVDKDFVWRAFDEEGADWAQINTILKRMSSR